MQLFDEPEQPDMFFQRARNTEKVSNLVDIFSKYSLSLQPEVFHDSSAVFDWTGARPPNLARARMEYPHMRVSARGEALFTLLELSSLLRKDLTVTNFDTDEVGSINSFEDLKSCYLKYSLKLIQVDERFYKPENYIMEEQALAFLKAVKTKMLKAYPLESLSYALSDSYTAEKLRTTGTRKFTSLKSRFDAIPPDTPGLIFLARSAPDRESLLSSKLLAGALSSSVVNSSGGSFSTIGVQFMPEGRLDRLGGVFVPTENAKASSDLLLMVAQNFFFEGATSPDYVPKRDYKTLFEKSFITALKSHKVLE